MDNKNVRENGLERSLKERHIQLIALGGTIGVGLFYGSASAIAMAGPAILITYIVGGIFIFFILRALGEMAVNNPVAGSFSTYAYDYLGKLPGFITGWTYWFMWVTTCMAELVAIGVYMKYWFPDVPQWIFVFLSLIAMTLVNLITVKLYGEFEFWFALIKIIVIVIMIATGILTIFFGLANGGIPVWFNNLWENGGFAPNGYGGVVMAIGIVMYAYLGIEMIGLTAGEAKNPTKTIPAAIDKVFWRILVFYVGAIFVILCMYPWNKIGIMGSPFVVTFDKLGIHTAAGIVNFVVLTAALSSCNSGIYSTGRMVYSLSIRGKTSSPLGNLNKRNVPSKAILLTGAVLFVCVILNFFDNKKIFIHIISVATTGALWAWMAILLSHLYFRKSITAEELAKSKYKMPLYPYSNYITLLFIVIVYIVMLIDSSSRIPAMLTPLWFVFLVLIYWMTKKKRKLNLPN